MSLIASWISRSIQNKKQYFRLFKWKKYSAIVYQHTVELKFVSFVAEEHEGGRTVESSIIKDEGGA